MKKEKITIAEIDKLASLSELNFTAEEKKVLVGEVASVIEMLNACASVPTEDIEPSRINTLSQLRVDEVVVSMDTNDALLDAPESKEGYFVVPKVVE